MKILSIDRTKCSGCGICQSSCALARKRALQPCEARIQVRQAGGRETEYVSFCQHCAEPVCVSACLKGIIDKDLKTGIVGRETDRCFECAACSLLCPMGAVVHDTSLNAFVTCDACGGDPVCVRACPTGALSYGEPSQISSNVRSESGLRLFAWKEVQP